MGRKIKGQRPYTKVQRKITEFSYHNKNGKSVDVNSYTRGQWVKKRKKLQKK